METEVGFIIKATLSRRKWFLFKWSDISL